MGDPPSQGKPLAGWLPHSLSPWLHWTPQAQYLSVGVELTKDPPPASLTLASISSADFKLIFLFAFLNTNSSTSALSFMPLNIFYPGEVVGQVTYCL